MVNRAAYEFISYIFFMRFIIFKHTAWHIGMILVLFTVHGLELNKARRGGPGPAHGDDGMERDRACVCVKYKACTRHISSGPGRTWAWTASRPISSIHPIPSSVVVTLSLLSSPTLLQVKSLCGVVLLPCFLHGSATVHVHEQPAKG